MKEKVAKTAIMSRRGERHSVNPYVQAASLSTRSGIKRISNKDGNRMLVVNEGTGEIMSPAGFWQAQEVDKTQFVKLFVNGVRALKELSGAGTKVFEILYLRVQEGIGKERVFLTFPSLDQELTPLGETTFYRGMKELLDKDFIAESEAPGLYFLNMDYMWNGDRLAFVKEFRIKGSKQNDQQHRDLLESEGQQRLTE